MKKILLLLFIFLNLYIFPNDKPIPDTFFGLHMHKVLKKDKPWPTVPFKTWRLWDTGICWPEVQPNKDEWDFSLIDKAVTLAAEKDVEIVINIGLSPRWAAARPNNKSGYGEELTASEPKNIEDWKFYVRTLAERYKGKIKYWEIWNEPDMRLFYTGTPKKMAELAKEAYIILKEVDPENMIISPAVTGYVALIPWLSSFLKAGGKDYIDIIGTHFYVWFKPDSPEKVVHTINVINQYKEENNIPDLPIWNTECGIRKKNIPDKELGMGYIMRLAIVQWHYGIERFMIYSWDNNYQIRMVDKDYENENHLSLAFREAQKWLIGAVSKDLVKVGNNVWIARLKRNGADARMIWHSNDANPKYKINYKIPDGWNHLIKIKQIETEIMDIPDSRKIDIGVSPVLLFEDGFLK
jgi:hypothetical protein